MIGAEGAAGLYTIAHFIYLLCIFSLIAIGVILVKKYARNKIETITLIIAIIVTVFEVIKIGYIHYRDHIILGIEKSSPDAWIPLSFCALFIYAIWLSLSKNNFIHKIGQTFLVSGAMIAGTTYLFYPSTSLYTLPWYNFLSFHGMGYHGLMLFTGIINLLYGDTKPTLKNFKYYIAFIFPLFIVAIVLSYLIDANFMFFRNAYALPEILKTIQSFSAIIYIVCIMFGYTILYFAAMLINKIFNKKEKHNERNI